MKMIGIVGPYFSKKPKKIEENIINAELFAIALANLEIPFFCPHLHTRHFEIKARASENFYRKLDIHILTSSCSALLVMPGWQNSEGTKNEIALFKKLKRPIFYPQSPDDLDEIKRWYKKN